jgi:hypothetical protein
MEKLFDGGHSYVHLQKPRDHRVEPDQVIAKPRLIALVSVTQQARAWIERSAKYADVSPA